MGLRVTRKLSVIMLFALTIYMFGCLPVEAYHPYGYPYGTCYESSLVLVPHYDGGYHYEWQSVPVPCYSPYYSPPLWPHYSSPLFDFHFDFGRRHHYYHNRPHHDRGRHHHRR